jgi:hypothetical protein
MQATASRWWAAACSTMPAPPRHEALHARCLTGSLAHREALVRRALFFEAAHVGAFVGEQEDFDRDVFL